MKDRRRTTAFYMEMILLVAVLTGIVDMLGGGDSAACHLEMQKILARFNNSMAPDPDGGYCVEITWIDYDGLISYNISVAWQEDSEQVYNLKTAVFYG